MKILFALGLLSLSLAAGAVEIRFQVLGSGGPVADDGRASSAYVVYLDDEARLLLEAGGGSFLRFGEAGLRMDSFEFIGLSHFHTDHSSEFPAFLKSAWFGSKTSDLMIAGPAAGGDFPGLKSWLRSLFAAGRGAYAYLADFLVAGQGRFHLRPVEIALRGRGEKFITGNPEYRISAIAVPHGPVPSLAYKIRIGDAVLVVSGDQNLSDPAFIDFVEGADLWVMPLPIPEGAGEAARNLHALPSQIARVATKARVKTLLLSHFMRRSLASLDDSLDLIKTGYAGDVLVAEDLAQWQLTRDGWREIP